MESKNAINETIQKLEQLHKMLPSLSFDTSLERNMFFSLNKSFDDWLAKAEARVQELLNRKLISSREWRVLMDRLKKLEN